MNSFYSFQWIFSKHVILVVDIMKMWVVDGAKINFDRIRAFEQFLHCRV